MLECVPGQKTPSQNAKKRRPLDPSANIPCCKHQLPRFVLRVSVKMARRRAWPKYKQLPRQRLRALLGCSPTNGQDRSLDPPQKSLRLEPPFRKPFGKTASTSAHVDRGS